MIMVSIKIWLASSRDRLTGFAKGVLAFRSLSKVAVKGFCSRCSTVIFDKIQNTIPVTQTQDKGLEVSSMQLTAGSK